MKNKTATKALMVILIMAIAVNGADQWSKTQWTDLQIYDTHIYAPDTSRLAGYVRAESIVTISALTNSTTGSIKLYNCNLSDAQWKNVTHQLTQIQYSPTTGGRITAWYPKQSASNIVEISGRPYYSNSSVIANNPDGSFEEVRWAMDTGVAVGNTWAIFTFGNTDIPGGGFGEADIVYQDTVNALTSNSPFYFNFHNITWTTAGNINEDSLFFYDKGVMRNGTVIWESKAAATSGDRGLHENALAMSNDLVDSNNSVSVCEAALGPIGSDPLENDTEEDPLVPPETVITEGDHDYNVTLTLEYAPGAGTNYLAGVWPSDISYETDTNVFKTNTREEIMQLLGPYNESFTNNYFGSGFTYTQSGTTPSQYLYLSAWNENGSRVIRRVQPSYTNRTYSNDFYLTWINSEVDACIKFVNFYDKTELADVNYSIRVFYEDGSDGIDYPTADQCHTLRESGARIEVWAKLTGYWDVQWKEITSYYIPGEPLVVGMIPNTNAPGALKWNVTGYVMNSSKTLEGVQVYATVIYSDRLNDVLGPVLSNDTGYYIIEKIPDQTTFWLQFKETGHYTAVLDRIPANSNVYKNVTLRVQYSESNEGEQWTKFVARDPSGGALATTLYCKAESSTCDTREFTMTPPFDAFMALDLGCKYDVCCLGTNYPRQCNPYTEDPVQELIFVPDVPTTGAECGLRGHVQYKSIDGNITFLEGNVRLMRDNAVTMTGPTSENMPYEFALRCDTQYKVCFRYLERDACSDPLIVESINGAGTGLHQNLVIEASEFELTNNTTWFNLIFTNIGPMMGAFIFMTMLFFGLAVMTKVIKEIQT